MKKNQIKKIPPLQVKKICNRKISYVVAADKVNIGNCTYLLLDVFRNKKKNFKQPLLRICMNQKEFANWYANEDTWDQKILENSWIIATGEYIHMDNVWISETSLDIVKQFTNSSGDWDDMILQEQKHINFEKAWQCEKRAQEALEDRIKQMSEIPQEFENWLDGLFDHTLFYKRHGRMATVTCTACGNTSTYVVQQQETGDYDISMIEPVYEVPRHNQWGTCLCCKTQAMYKASGKSRYVEQSKAVFLIQNVDEETVVLRQFLAGRRMFCDGTVQQEYDEEMRTFYYRNGKVQKDYNKYDNWTGKSYWDHKSLYGMANINPRSGVVYPGSFVELEQSYMKYSSLKEYISWYPDRERLNINRYMEEYHRFPGLEMLIKLKLSDIVEQLIDMNVCYVKREGNNAQEILGINKKKIKTLQQHRGDVKLLKIMKMEHRNGLDLNIETEMKLTHMVSDAHALGATLQYMSVPKFINHMRKYAQIGMDMTNAPCGAAEGHMKHITQLYMDYIEMRETMHYDMTDSIILFPKNLQEAHDKMVIETHREEIDRRIAEVNHKFTDIAKKFKLLSETYNYAAEGFIIRPASSAGEIVMEGRLLHHCVGGDGYLRKHNEQESYILFLRKDTKPEEPYVTVELRKDRVVQWYGAYDKKPEKERIDRWLDNYLMTLISRNTG